jgi:hypothetical protein
MQQDAKIQDCVDVKFQDLNKAESQLGYTEIFGAFPENLQKNYRTKEARTAQTVQPLGYGLSTEGSGFDST